MTTTIPLQQTGKINIDVKRYDGGSYISGRYVNGTTSITTIEANVQPVNSEDLLNLPEAQRTRDIIKIYTSFKFQTAVEGSISTKADIVEYDGSEWEVHRSKTYSMGVLNHTRAIAMRLDIK